MTLTGADGRTEADIVVQNQVSTARDKGSTGASVPASGVTGDRTAVDKPEVKRQGDVVQQLDQEHMVDHANADGERKQSQPADGQQQSAGGVQGQSGSEQPTAGEQKPQTQEPKTDTQQVEKPVTKASSSDDDADGDGKLTALDNEYKPTR